MKSSIHNVSRSEPGLHVKTDKKRANMAKSLGVAHPTGQGSKSRIVLGTKNQGTSKLDGVTK